MAEATNDDIISAINNMSDSITSAINDMNSSVGSINNDDVTNAIYSLINYLEDVLGINGEKDNGNSLISYFKDILGTNSQKDNGNSFINYLKDILGTNGEKISAEGTGSSLLRELNHLHGAHWHQSSHYCEQIPVSCGHPNDGFGMPYATVLIAEFMSSQDLDNNGYIYGRDFMIAESADKPIMLKPIESSPEWIDPDISIEWNSLREWVEGESDINPLA